MALTSPAEGQPPGASNLAAEAVVALRIAEQGYPADAQDEAPATRNSLQRPARLSQVLRADQAVERGDHLDVAFDHAKAALNRLGVHESLSARERAIVRLRNPLQCKRPGRPVERQEALAAMLAEIRETL